MTRSHDGWYPIRLFVSFVWYDFTGTTTWRHVKMTSLIIPAADVDRHKEVVMRFDRRSRSCVGRRHLLICLVLALICLVLQPCTRPWPCWLQRSLVTNSFNCSHRVEMEISVSISCKVRAPSYIVYSFIAGTVFIRQNLTSLDVRFWRIKMVPAMKELNSL